MTPPFNKTAGKFELRVTDGWPRWFEIVMIDQVHTPSISGFAVEDARDLRYLLDRAIKIVEVGDD